MRYSQWISPKNWASLYRKDDPVYRYVILAYLGLSQFVDVLITLSLGILLPGISDDLGLSPSQQGWLGSSVVIGALLFVLPASLWLSRYSAKKVMTLGLMSAGLLVLAQSWSPGFGVLIVARISFGLSTIVRQPARAILTTQWFPRREIVFANGVINSTYGLSAIVGLSLTPILLIWLNDSWRATFTVYAIVFLVIGVAWFFMGKERKADAKESLIGPSLGSPMSCIKRYPQLWYLAVGMFGVSVMWTGLITFWPTYALEHEGISLTTSGGILGFAGVVESVGSVAATIYLSRFAKRDMRKPLVIVLVSMMVGGAVGMMMTGSVPLLIALGFVHGIGFSFAPIVQSVPFELPGATQREIAVAFGFMEMAMRGGGVAGPLIAGFLQEATGDLQMTLVVTTLCGMLLVAVTPLMYANRRTAMVASHQDEA